MYSYRIEQAIRAAAILHRDQTRKGIVPLPYVTHVYAVALIISDYTESENAFIGGLLHDTLEDTDYTAEELREDFGENVLTIVLAVTEPQDSVERKYTWKERKKVYAAQLRTAPVESLMIAAADKIHNMRTTVEEYYNDHERYLKEYGGSLDERALMYQDISNTLNTRLNNSIVTEFNHVYTEFKNFILDVKTKQSADKAP